MATVIRLIVLLLAAFATGALLVNWVGLARAMARMSSASAYTEFHQATNQTFDPYMPIVVFGALFGGVALVALSPGMGSLSGGLAIAGICGYVGVLAVGVPTNVRINKLIARWSVQAPPEDWRVIRARWVRFHIFRTLFSLPALACYILSVLLNDH
jgi:uncharacterized membrane protein